MDLILLKTKPDTWPSFLIRPIMFNWSPSAVRFISQTSTWPVLATATDLVLVFPISCLDICLLTGLSPLFILFAGPFFKLELIFYKMNLMMSLFT